jgi:hypothetical protein
MKTFTFEFSSHCHAGIGGGCSEAGRERSASAVSEGGGFQGESGWLE